jgi:hypothetical protein
LLVALALTGLVTLILFAGMRLAAEGLDRLAGKAERIEERRSLEELLRREFAAVVPEPLVPTEAPFRGDSTGVSFVTLAADSGPALYRIELRFEANSADRELVIVRRSAAPEARRPIERSVLARHLRGFRLAYFGITPEGEIRWRDRWDDFRFPPRLVQVSIDDGGAAQIPPLIFRLWAAPG